MRDLIIILRGYFNFRHVLIEMKFISRRARRDRIVSRTQRWHLHFHLLGNVVDVSLAYLHRGDERCIRRSWFPIILHEVAGENLRGWTGWRPHYDDTNGKQRGRLIRSFIMWQAEVIPSYCCRVLFAHRYLSSSVLSRTCLVMKAIRRSARMTFMHLLIQYIGRRSGT